MRRSNFPTLISEKNVIDRCISSVSDTKILGGRNQSCHCHQPFKRQRERNERALKENHSAGALYHQNESLTLPEHSFHVDKGLLFLICVRTDELEYNLFLFVLLLGSRNIVHFCHPAPAELPVPFPRAEHRCTPVAPNTFASSGCELWDATCRCCHSCAASTHFHACY